MEFQILGDLAVWHDGHAVPLGGHQQRAVLAILVLHTGEFVSADGLIEAVWGDRPPARAAKAIQVHVSRLRHALAAAGGPAAEVIVTRDHGYLLRIRPGQVDARVFERLLDDARRSGANQGWQEVAAVLREALGLWHGPPLADFSYDAFARSEIARLEELRLEAQELRIDADLALGCHAPLVGELEALTAQHPLRERMQRQRMLALYRSGRQSEALQVCRDARTRLVSELGIEPSLATRELHDAMLRQDPGLDTSAGVVAPAPPIPPTGDAANGAARRRMTSAMIAVAVAIAAATVAAIALTGRGPGRMVGHANSVAVIDPARNGVVGDIGVGQRPGDVSAGGRDVWVANLDDKSVSQIDSTSARVVRTLYPGTSVDGLAAGARALWIADFQRDTVTRLDPTFGDAVHTVHVGPRALVPGAVSPGPSPVTVFGGSVWAATPNATVARIGARAGRDTSAVAVGNDPAGVAGGAHAVWVSDDVDDTVSRIDSAGVVTKAVPVGSSPSGVAVGAGSVWVADTLDDTVMRIDPATGATRAVIHVGARPRGLAVGLGAVWVADSRGAAVSRIDPRSNRVVRTIPVGGSPEDIAVAAGRVWVSVQAAAPPPGGPLPGGTLRVAQSTDIGSTDPAVAFSYGGAAVQLEFSTCAKLLNYPDLPGSRGIRLVPEVAQALPRVSSGGRTYTFTIRPGFRFSPPSGQAVTARAFQRALERFLSPTMQPDASPPLQEMRDIVGVGEYRAGRTRHVAGITATTRTLTIRLVRRAPSLPARIAMPYFCAVPPSTPVRPGGVEPIPSAGPYYLVGHTPGSELVLGRNPNYRGPRPHHFAAIQYRFGGTPASNTALVEAGRADYVDDAVGQVQTASAVSPAVDARLERAYGPHSIAARSGRQRYFVNRTLGSAYLMLNARRPLFASARMRRAANFAVDRVALARDAQPGYVSVPADQYLPPTLPGFRAATLYPLGGPDLVRARSLAGAGGGHAVMYTCNLPPCLQAAEIVRADLRGIGVTVAIRQFPFPRLYRHEAPGQPYDIAWMDWGADYADPSQFIGPAAPGLAVDFPGAAARRARHRIAAAARLSGAKRLRAYGRLDIELSTHVAPAVAFATSTAHDFFSAGVGCQSFQPIYGIDLAALCQRRPEP